MVRGRRRTANLSVQTEDDGATEIRSVQLPVSKSNSRSSETACGDPTKQAQGEIMTEPILITPRQNEYLLQLSTGPKTTRDLVLDMMLSGHSVSKMLKKLRNAGLIRSSQLRGAPGNVHIHELTAPYANLNIFITTGGHGSGSSTHAVIPNKEVLYAAILRNAGLIGQRLTNQYHEVYPDRSASCVLKQVVQEAKRRGLCR